MTDEIGAAVRSYRTTTKPTRREGCDHETDDQHASLRRWSDGGKRRSGSEPQRIRAWRMGQTVVRRRGHDVRQRLLPARRRLPIRPADLRALCGLLGNRVLGGKSGGQPDLSRVDIAAQVRRLGHAYYAALDGH